MIPNPATPTFSFSPGTQAPVPDAPAAGSASAAAPGPQPAPASPSAPAAPAAPLTPVQLFWDVAKLAFALLTRLVGVLHPVKARFPKQSWQIFHLCTDLPRILLTIRYAPERVTSAQLRHLTRARHILQALFGYTLPTLGPRTSPSASTTSRQSPSASSKNATPPGARKPLSATTPTPAIHAVSEVPSVPEVSTPGTPSAASSRAYASSPGNPQPAICNQQSAISDTHPSHNPQSAIHNPQSSFSPHIPDYQTLFQAIKANSLPANCAGALLDDPGDALVKALHQLHAIYFSLYPNQSPSPSSGNPQSAICNPQSPSPSHSQSEMESPSPSPSQSNSLFNPQSAFSNPQSSICNLQSGMPNSTAPP